MSGLGAGTLVGAGAALAGGAQPSGRARPGRGPRGGPEPRLPAAPGARSPRSGSGGAARPWAADGPSPGARPISTLCDGA